MAKTNKRSNSFAPLANSTKSGGKKGGLEVNGNRKRSRDRGGKKGGAGKTKVDALGRLMVRILRHTAPNLNLNIRGDGYVKVQDMLKLDTKSIAKIPLSSHTVNDVKEAVRMNNWQRFSLIEENGQLLIRANQGHTLKSIKTELLLEPFVPSEEVSVLIHGTYKKKLQSILEHGLKRMRRLHVHFFYGLPTEGMRGNVDVFIFLNIRKALEEGMKLYISDNNVILTEGFDGVVPPKYFEKIESWPDRKPISF